MASILSVILFFSFFLFLIVNWLRLLLVSLESNLINYMAHLWRHFCQFLCANSRNVHHDTLCFLDIWIYEREWEIPHINDGLLHGLLSKQHFSCLVVTKKKIKLITTNEIEKINSSKRRQQECSHKRKQKLNGKKQSSNIDVPHTLAHR